MLVDPVDHSLVQSSDSVLARLSDGLTTHTSPETHASVIELASRIHADVAVPALLALSANSPFCQGRDSGFASARTIIFQGFPRTGTARFFPATGTTPGGC